MAAEADGTIEGYAYAAGYRPRPAYRFTVENSVYVRPGRMRMGTGRQLMATPVERCTDLGCRHTGTLPSIGYKFDRWADSVLMVLPLGEGDRSPP